MLIWKEPHTDTETPWHQVSASIEHLPIHALCAFAPRVASLRRAPQDEAYWPSGMTDKRTVTVWCALDEATLDNVRLLGVW